MYVNDLSYNDTYEFLLEKDSVMGISWRTLACCRHFSRLFPNKTDDQIAELMHQGKKAYMDSNHLDDDTFVEMAARE